ncbi:hypothetical protein SMU108_04208 [Streptococcus mutans M230]|jgi:hypothetical protein|nr:hypothetical protein SMU33_01019 [Streptococcus mutans 11SSST2]EMC57925.1 hypothetical protein SMU108_04208 [Streptococcus mutans M230]
MTEKLSDICLVVVEQVEIRGLEPDSIINYNYIWPDIFCLCS